MKKLIISLLLFASCSSNEDVQEAVQQQQCDCIKQEYNVTLSYYQTDVVAVGLPYTTCEQSTFGTVEPYEPYTRPPLNGGQITIKARKITCP